MLPHRRQNVVLAMGGDINRRYPYGCVAVMIRWSYTTPATEHHEQR